MFSHNRLADVRKLQVKALTPWTRKLLLVPLIAVLAASGCAATPPGAPKHSPGTLGASHGGQPIAMAELDELTRAFADRYVGLLSSTCDALKKDNSDPVQRREIQELMLNCATNVYDIASNADAFTRMLDLVVVTTLESQVWIDDDRAGQVFGDRAEVLIRTLHHGRTEAWALAAQVLRPDQLDLLDYLIWDWRRHNPDMVRASFVRFSNFAIGRGMSADAQVVAAGGFFPNIAQAGQSIDEARLLTERMFYQLKRYPTLLRWQVAAMKDDLIATPEMGKALTDVHRLSDQVEQLPRNVAAERQAILAALDERMKSADSALSKLNDTLTEAKQLVSSVGQTGETLDKMLKTADPLFARFDAWDRWTVTLPGHHPFNIREYMQGATETGLTVDKINDLMKSSTDLLGSSEWDRRIAQSQGLVNGVFWRICLAIGVFFAMLILYRVVTLLLTRRLSINAEKTSAASTRRETGQEAQWRAHYSQRQG